MGQTDRETDGRTSDRYIDPVPHTMRAASITHLTVYTTQSTFIKLILQQLVAALPGYGGISHPVAGPTFTAKPPPRADRKVMFRAIISRRFALPISSSHERGSAVKHNTRRRRQFRQAKPGSRVLAFERAARRRKFTATSKRGSINR